MSLPQLSIPARSPVDGTQPDRADRHLSAGQWAALLVGGGDQALRGFVFGLRGGEMLFTMPDLGAPPAGLVSGAQVTLRYSSQLGQHSGRSTVLRVGSGPPVTVVLQRPGSVETEQRRRFRRTVTRLALELVVVASSRLPAGSQDKRARTQNLGAGGLLAETSLTLQPGDSVRVTVSLSGRLRQSLGPSFTTLARVVRTQPSTNGRGGSHLAGLEFVLESGVAREGLARLALALVG